MMDPSDNAPPEVTIEPADNGFVVRHHQKSTKKDESGRTIRRVASTTDEALSHARTALGGGKKSAKKKSKRDGQTGSGMSAAEGETGSSPSPAAHGLAAHAMHAHSRNHARRRRPRTGGRG